MPKFSANLNFLFKEYSFLDRFEASKEAGFHYVEYMFPYEYPPETLKSLLDKYELKQVLFNLPAGEWDKGERGIAVDPNKIDTFRKGVEQAVKYARVLDVKLINCLVGKRLEGIPPRDQRDVLIKNLSYASFKLAKEGLTLLVEPLNTYDIPGFFLYNTQDTIRLFKEIGETHIKLQYDVYHMQKMEGNLTETIRDNLTRIGHIQIADNPGRHQPGTGEINYRFLLDELDRMGYKGFVGLEYNPLPDTLSSLSWVKELGFSL